MNVRRAYVDSDSGARLYGPAEVARALAVTVSAVSNWTARGTGPLPAPAGYVGHGAARSGRSPVWTADQVAAAVRDELVQCRRRLRATRRRRLALQRQETALRARIVRMSETAAHEPADSVMSTPRHGADVAPATERG